jgi:hypothetical protein
MNFKIRLKSIEKQLSGSNGIEFLELLKPEFVYKGKPFNTLDEMFNKFNIVERPQFFSDNEIIILLEKKLLSISSLFAQEIRSKAIKEMERMM